MALDESKVTKNIAREAILWRYMTLDKLINLLCTKKLFFAPLYSYQNSDPFEGIQPKVGLQQLENLNSSVWDEYLAIVTQFRDLLLECPNRDEIEEKQLKKFEECMQLGLNTQTLMKKVSFRIYKSTLVNCWHQNEFESEAMWRLYSENSKGIAIQTTVQNLVDSIDDQRIRLSEVKYINFNDESLNPKDFVVNGYLGALLKRKSFEHEKEIRLFFQPQVDPELLKAEKYEYKSQLIDIDISQLISKIYISPYAKEPYISSVKEIIKMYGIDENKIIYSDLLNVDESIKKYFNEDC